MRILHAAAIVSTLLGMGACSFIYPGDNLVGPGPDAGSSDGGGSEAGGDADSDAGTDVVADGLPGIASIDADLTHVYWCNTSAGTVMRRHIDGRAPETVASKEASPRFVAVSSGHVYWSAGKIIRRVPLGGLGGTTPESFTTATEEPSGFAFDRSNTPALIWSERAAGRIKSRSMTASSDLVLKDSLIAPTNVGIESGTLYVVLASSELITFNFGGGPLRVELGDTSDVKVLSNAYFITKPLQGTVVRRDRGGVDKTTPVVLDAVAPSSVATDGSNWVYWAEPSLGRIRRKKL